MKYAINGVMGQKPNPRKFSKVVEADSEKLALERLYAEMGSKHGLRRNKVKIIKVEQVK
ncbi:MAG: 50S ribosomal protein L18a [Chloroflexi bacterium CG_4_10_14_0_8_um_filter_57_5]|nr:MAG: 50S ribosomal protein L18a [Chloroflexi bacterium CG_4_10_14_0_8_um_filter_57_5]